MLLSPRKTKERENGKYLVDSGLYLEFIHGNLYVFESNLQNAGILIYGLSRYRCRIGDAAVCTFFFFFS